MSTITGLKLTQMGVLSLGSTGSRFYVVSAGGSSFQMYEKDLYNTLNTLHVSGAYQPKSEDWRFVHTSGNEYVTGVKRFASSINSDLITSYSNLSIHTPIVNILGATLLPRAGLGTSLDWSGRILSGNWVKNGQYILTNIDSGNLYNLTTGFSGQANLNYATISNLVTTGYNNYNNDINISGNLVLTGSNLYNLTNNFSGVFNTSGTNWQNQLNTLTTNLYTTGSSNYNNSINLSGRLQTTGSNLYSYLNTFSGNSQNFTTSITPTGSGYYIVQFPLGAFNAIPKIQCTVETSGNTTYYVNVTGRSTSNFHALFSSPVGTSGVILHTYATINN